MRTAAEVAKIAVIDSIVEKEDLYEVLGVKRTAKAEEIRRGFLNRSRVCHPE
jgi:curved DNA-binding protein CbpA